jgi:recombination protein RecA
MDTARLNAEKRLISGKSHLKGIRKNGLVPGIIYGKGISKEGDLLDLAVTHNIIDKAGTWFSYGEERLGQGRENVKKFLEQNPEMMAEIELKVRRELGLLRGEEPAAETPEAKKE